jgi:tetratricopeptide (TPR) repeat protein/protocatechuate 3,4-dioxygenase beta subunit
MVSRCLVTVLFIGICLSRAANGQIQTESITGRVVNSNNQPVVDARVIAYSVSGSPKAPNWRRMLETKTDEHGRYSIAISEGLSCDFWILPNDYTARMVSAGNDRSNLGDIQVESSHYLTGILRDENGVPAPKVWVGLWPQSDQRGGEVEDDFAIWRSTLSDAEGRFRIGPIDDGKYRIGFRKPDPNVFRAPYPSHQELVFVDRTMDINGANIQEPITIQASPCYSFSGRCLSQSNAMIEGRLLVVEGKLDGLEYSRIHAKSDSEGRFALKIPKNLNEAKLSLSRSGSETIFARIDNQVQFMNGSVDLPTRQQNYPGIEIIITDALPVVLRVVDDQGRPSSGVQVAVRYEDPAIQQQFGEIEKWLPLTTQRDTQGELLVSNLMPGAAAIIQVSADNCLTEQLSIDSESNRNKVRVVSLKRKRESPDVQKAKLLESLRKDEAEIANKGATPLTRLRMGTIYISLGDTQSAIFHLQAALELDPILVPALNNLAVLLARSEPTRVDEAIALIDRALLMEPNSPELHDSRGEILERAERFGDAIASLKRTLEIQPERIGSRTRLARILEKMGETAEAEEHRKKIRAFRKSSDLPSKKPQSQPM